MNAIKKRPTGFWIFSGIAILLNLFYPLDKAMAIINYDFAVSLELQEPLAEITTVGVALNKGFGFVDTFFYVSLFVIGIIGLLKIYALEFYNKFRAVAVTVIWPIVGLSSVFYAKGSPRLAFRRLQLLFHFTFSHCLLWVMGLLGFYLEKKRCRSMSDREVNGSMDSYGNDLFIFHFTYFIVKLSS